jgi:Ca-activated chloride channel family protein
MRTPAPVFQAALLALMISQPLASPAGPEARALPEAQAAELYRRTAAGLQPLPIIDLAVHLDVTGLLVHGTVVQVFQNPTGEVIEALYVFPLPERAAVHFMEMAIGERHIVSVIQERQEAKRTYDAARAAGKKAALLEQERPNLFTTTVANINPGENVAVTLEYIQEIDYDAGEFGLAFPLTYTPRVQPVLGSDAAPSRGRSSRAIPRAAFSVRLEAGFPLEAVESASHSLDRWWDGEALMLEAPADGIAADRDFLLRWRPQLGATPQSALFSEERDGARYHLLMVLPPAPVEDIGLATETLFVFDVSGSMNGPSITQAREALLAALDLLRPDDTFNILAFNDRVHPFHNGFVPAREADLGPARDWVRGLTAGGGTMIHPALTAGLAMMQAGRPWGTQRIIFLTDGAGAGAERRRRRGVGVVGDRRVSCGAAPRCLAGRPDSEGLGALRRGRDAWRLFRAPQPRHDEHRHPRHP